MIWCSWCLLFSPLKPAFPKASTSESSPISHEALSLQEVSLYKVYAWSFHSIFTLYIIASCRVSLGVLWSSLDSPGCLPLNISKQSSNLSSYFSVPGSPNVAVAWPASSSSVSRDKCPINPNDTTIVIGRVYLLLQCFAMCDQICHPKNSDKTFQEPTFLQQGLAMTGSKWHLGNVRALDSDAFWCILFFSVFFHVFSLWCSMRVRSVTGCSVFVNLDLAELLEHIVSPLKRQHRKVICHCNPL